MISAAAGGAGFKKTWGVVGVRVTSTDGNLLFKEVSRFGKASALEGGLFPVRFEPAAYGSRTGPCRQFPSWLKHEEYICGYTLLF